MIFDNRGFDDDGDDDDNNHTTNNIWSMNYVPVILLKHFAH